MKRAAIAMATMLSGCLPADTRSEPASILVSVQASDATRSGFTTDDGWTITFERFLVGMGSARMSADQGPGTKPLECTAYYDANYDRVFDFARADGPRKLAQVYALGTCDLRFDVHTPALEALLDPGVAVEDAAFMRENTGDPERAGTTSIRIRGEAWRDGTRKTFDWSFLTGYGYSMCGAPFELESGDAGTALVVLHGEELFRDGADGPLAFDPFADADRGGDGAITMDDLSLPPPIPSGNGGGGGAGGGGLFGLETLSARLYYRGVIHLASVDGEGPCQGISY